MKNQRLTQAYLKSIINYDPETGEIKWLEFKKNRHENLLATSASSRGYNNIAIDGKLYRASRIAWLYMEGYFPEYEVDHINRDRGDDRWYNLRHATRACNSSNRMLSKNNKSGVAGVSFEKATSKWKAHISHNNKRKTIGRYHSMIDAVLARYNAEQAIGENYCNQKSTAYEFLKEKRVPIGTHL